MIKVYSADWCYNCQALKHQLKQRNIAYDEIDVDTVEGAAMAERDGVRGLPYTIATNKHGSEMKWVGITLPVGIEEFINESA